MTNILEFLIKEYTFTTKGYVLLMGLIIFLLILIIIIYYIHSLNKKIEYAEKPKFGFLGKQLYQFIFVAFIFAISSVSILLVSQGPPEIKESAAKEELSVQFDYTIIRINGNKYTIRISTVPLINDVAWGNDSSRNFDIFLNFKGPTNTNKFFYDINLTTGAVFESIFEKGIYTINITIVSDTETKEFTKTMIL
mgnify:CR=1 FL=1